MRFREPTTIPFSTEAMRACLLRLQSDGLAEVERHLIR